MSASPSGRGREGHSAFAAASRDPGARLAVDLAERVADAKTLGEIAGARTTLLEDLEKRPDLRALGLLLGRGEFREAALCRLILALRLSVELGHLGIVFRFQAGAVGSDAGGLGISVTLLCLKPASDAPGEGRERLWPWHAPGRWPHGRHLGEDIGLHGDERGLGVRQVPLDFNDAARATGDVVGEAGGSGLDERPRALPTMPPNPGSLNARRRAG